MYVTQPDAGLLLGRIRDEMRRNVAIYQSLYMLQLEQQDNSNENQLEELEKRVESLEAENWSMRRELAEVQSRLNVAERGEMERRGLAEKRHTEEQVFLRK